MSLRDKILAVNDTERALSWREACAIEEAGFDWRAAQQVLDAFWAWLDRDGQSEL